jgi:3-deoxy-D-manno-octulosonic-acid transferase
MRALYSFAWRLALPLVLTRLWWRGRKEPGYRLHWAERLGFYSGKLPPGSSVVWVHAVSVGETRAAEPLVDALLDSDPACRIILTHMTPTGRATGQALFAKYGNRLQQSYMPYDLGTMVGRFIRHFSPRLCILMETEVWPNAIAQCARRNVPVALVNAALGLTCIAAQTPADAERLQQIGARDVQVTGSVKFDVVPPPAMLETGAQLRRQIGKRPVLLCASTREGEEALILDAFRKLDKSSVGDLLLLIVPRHPQRFDDVADLIAAHGLTLCRRSAMPPESADGIRENVMLGDSMGEMFAYYAACDAAFIGGSLLPLGGQNLIEACAVGKPVLVGPHTFNFAAVTEDAIAAGAALRVDDATAMLAAARDWLSGAGACATMGAAAQAFAQQHRGATARTMTLLQPLLAARR